MKMNRSVLRRATALALGLSAASAQALTYDFDAPPDAQGWTATNVSASGRVPSIGPIVAGNPGGFFGMLDSLSPVASPMFASVSFAAQNLSSALGGSFSFDFRYAPVLDLPVTRSSSGVVTLFGGAGSVSADLFSNAQVATNPIGTWQTFALTLNDANWTGSAPGVTLSAVLAGLTGIRIDTDVRVLPGAAVGIDNVTIAAAVPEAHEWALMLAGLGVVGWLARRRPAAGATPA